MLETGLKWVVFLLSGATALIFLIGIVSMSANTAFYQRNANLLMRLRVIFQGLTLAAFALLLLAK